MDKVNMYYLNVKVTEGDYLQNQPERYSTQPSIHLDPVAINKLHNLGTMETAIIIKL